MSKHLSTLLLAWICLWASNAAAQSITLQPALGGIVMSNGTSIQSISSNFTGQLDEGTQINAWYLFNLPSSQQPIGAAVLSFEGAAMGRIDRTYALLFSDVNSDLEVLKSSPSGSDTFADLQEGTSYGSLLVTQGAYSLPIDSAILQAAQQGPGYLAVGISNVSARALVPDGLFDNGVVLTAVSLELTLTAVPEPHAILLLSVGIVAVHRRPQSRHLKEA